MPGVQQLGECFGQAVRDRLDHDRRVVVVGRGVFVGDRVGAKAGGHR